ncbi:hypothetical protein INR49_024028 [Caranx melampygus]|nr:hypothetical protein INR49_024028 [Caranx melampygus]
MASPFVPVPVPMDRALSGGSNKLRRPQRASSLGSVSSSLEDSGRGCGGLGSQRQSRCMDRGNRSRTPPPLQSPVARARVNGTLETSVEYSSCPRSISDPAGEERPITPTVLGYEVMEERAKFTVYKLLVKKSPDESWVVFRRYTDFSRLNDKDNYDSDFLEDRQLGLQAFLQNLAFCETLEESNYRLQKELLEKQREIASLKRKLEEREQAILRLEKRINGECASPESPCGLSAQGSESSADADVESSAAEADQDMPDDTGSYLLVLWR